MQQKNYSITSSARASSLSGIASPIAFAALRLITSSNLVGCSTGSSAGFAPFRTLSTYSAARRYDILDRCDSGGEHDLHLPTEKMGGRGPATTIGHMEHVRASHHLEQFTRDVLRTS